MLPRGMAESERKWNLPWPVSGELVVVVVVLEKVEMLWSEWLIGSDELMSATLAINTRTPSSLVKEMESVLEPEGKIMQSSSVKSGVVELSTLTIPKKVKIAF